MPVPTENNVTSDMMTTRVATLHSAFRRIQVESMHDVPLLNPALTVATVGFRRWKAYWLGVLVTPWMMKLVGLPMLMQPLAQAEVCWQFPSGEYTLTRDILPEAGAYYSVSLFSPMHEFGDQAQAEATAATIMQSLFEAPDEQSLPASIDGKAESARGMTRRELLFGMFRDK
jgi:[NiFe] hydrogenase assembly HybE family chaperone